MCFDLLFAYTRPQKASENFLKLLPSLRATGYQSLAKTMFFRYPIWQYVPQNNVNKAS